MSTQLTIQTAGTDYVETPTPNTNPDSTGNWVKPSDSAIKSLLLRFSNTGGSPVTVTIDDPTSVTPVAATAFNPDIGVAVPATTGLRTFLIPDVTRFVDPATGRLNWTYSGALTGTCEVYGF
jgi:hypothetical protein